MADENSMDSRKQLDERFHNASAELRRDWCEKFPERIESADRMLTERKL
jgi:hypothetical protein